MRTRWEIVVWDRVRAEADLRAACEEALAEITDAESLLSAFRPDAALFALNARLGKSAGSFVVSSRLYAFLRAALYLAEVTDGLFDPTLGSYDAVRLNDDALVTMHAGIRFDPGGIGKGYALDRAIETLRDLGISNALIHGGTSSVAVLGTDPSGEPWRVAIASPVENAEPVAVWILADGEALGVSANHGRTDHVIHPHTGEPVSDTLLAAVVAGSALAADAVSTALLAAGEDGLPHPVPGVLQTLTVPR